MTLAGSTELSDPAVLELAGADSLTLLRVPATKRMIRRIVVADAALTAGEARRLERRLNRWYFACGCEQGSSTVLLTLLSCLAGGLVSGFDGPLQWWRIILYLAAAALAGKGAGLLYAKVQLHRLYRDLETRYRNRGL